MNNRVLIGLIGASALVATISIGLLLAGGDSSGTSASAAIVATTEASTSTSTSTIPAPVVETAPSSSVPPATAAPLVVDCQAGYRSNEALPLRPCDKGTGVEMLQQGLVLDGYAVEVDGYFGQGTASALQQYQLKLGLDPSGVADAATWGHMWSGLNGFDLDGDGVIGPNEIPYD